MTPQERVLKAGMGWCAGTHGHDNSKAALAAAREGLIIAKERINDGCDTTENSDFARGYEAAQGDAIGTIDGLLAELAKEKTDGQSSHAAEPSPQQESGSPQGVHSAQAPDREAQASAIILPPEVAALLKEARECIGDEWPVAGHDALDGLEAALKAEATARQQAERKLEIRRRQITRLMHQRDYANARAEQAEHALADLHASREQDSERAFKAGWESGRGYGDNHHHFRGEQKERVMAKYLDELLSAVETPQTTAGLSAEQAKAPEDVRGCAIQEALDRLPPAPTAPETARKTLEAAIVTMLQVSGNYIDEFGRRTELAERELTDALDAYEKALLSSPSPGAFEWKNCPQCGGRTTMSQLLQENVCSDCSGGGR